MRNTDCLSAQTVRQAVELCRQTLQSNATADSDKAIAICWLAHLVADAHQPYHAGACTLIADANHCDYSKAYAIVDLKRAGATDDLIPVLVGDSKARPEADQQTLESARQLTVAAPTIPDSMFENLQKQFGHNQVASMVWLAASCRAADRISRVRGLDDPPGES